MTCQISQGFIFCPVIHFLILCLFFFVLYSKLELLYSSSVNLILNKFFKNTCLKFGNHYYVAFPSDIASDYYFLNDIFILHFQKSFTNLSEPLSGSHLKYTTRVPLFLNLSYFQHFLIYQFFYNYNNLKVVILVSFFWQFRDIWQFLHQNNWQDLIYFVNLSYGYNRLYILKQACSQVFLCMYDCLLPFNALKG